MDVPKQTDGKTRIALEEKGKLRKKVLARRDAMDKKLRKVKSAQICELLKEDLERSELYESGATVAVFSQFGSVVKLKDFAKKALADGLRIAYPVLVSKPDLDHLAMEFRKVSPDQLKTAPFVVDPLRVFNSENPAEMAEIESYKLCRPQQIDAMFVPIVAFDKKGGWVGNGTGNYDRYLPWVRNEARVVGVAFEEQGVDSIPIEDFDVPLDVISA